MKNGGWTSRVILKLRALGHLKIAFQKFLNNLEISVGRNFLSDFQSKNINAKKRPSGPRFPSSLKNSPIHRGDEFHPYEYQLSNEKRAPGCLGYFIGD